MSSVHTHDTGAPADSVEVLPTETGRIMSVGTYAYDADTKSRTGSLEFLEVVEGFSVRSVQKIQGAGVLDAKWRRSGPDVVGVLALSDGSIAIGEFVHDRCSFETQTTCPLQSDAITLSCDLGAGCFVVASLSSGRLAYGDGTRLDQIFFLPGHELEAWTVTIDVHASAPLLHSGGDDAKWKGWDLRSGSTAFTNSHHAAGVCSIQPHPRNSALIATGSYDKQCALWDRRRLQRPLLSVPVQSGVWRLRWHPRHDMLLLAACMYDGFYVFDMERAAPSAKYDPSALCYGCDWLDDDAAVTCSFYNHEVQIWSPAGNKIE